MRAHPRHGWTMWRQAMLALLLLVLLPAAARADPTFPQFTGLVTDAANILPPERKTALEAKLQALQQQTNHQLVVATIPSLQGYEISDYGYRLGRAWGVGLKGADNGAILIIAPNDRKVRVEVGYGLEPILTDALSSVIINQRILPAFKAGDMPSGIEAGTDALIQQLRLPDDQAKAKAAAAATEYNKTHQRRNNGGGIPVGAVIWIAIVGFILLSAMRRGGGRRYRRGDGGDWPIWLWAASEMMRDDRHGGGWGGGSSWGGGSDSGGGGWGGGGFTGGGGGSFGGGGASGSW